MKQLPQGEKIDIRRSARIKYLSIRMAPGRGVWVNAPYGVSDEEVRRFVEEKWDWICHNRAKLRGYEEHSSFDFASGSEILTKMHRISICDTEEHTPRYTIEKREITFFIPRIATVTQRKKLLQQLLLQLYRFESEHYLTPRILELACKHNFVFGKLSFRNNISNWGSCSSRDDISLNIKLMKLSDGLIDYVLLHELCHTREKNHGPSFWHLMEQVCPDFRQLREELKKHHTRL